MKMKLLKPLSTSLNPFLCKTLRQLLRSRSSWMVGSGKSL
jgi:hypothetical protein